MTLLPSMFCASRATASGARRHGFDENMPNIAVRPTAVFAISGSTGFSARPMPRSARNCATVRRWSQGPWKNPAGLNAVADAACPRRASSSARYPPSELPATWGFSPSTDTWRRNSASSSNMRSPTSSSSESGSGVSPWPGTSMATTRK